MHQHCSRMNVYQFIHQHEWVVARITFNDENENTAFYAPKGTGLCGVYFDIQVLYKTKWK